MKKKGIIILIISVILVLLIIGGTTTAIVVSNQQVNNNIIIPDIDDDQVFEYDGEEHQPKIKNLDEDELKKVVFSYAEKKDDSPEDEMYQSGLPKNAGIYFVKVDYEDNTQFKTMTINHVEITPQEDVSVIYNQQDIIYTNCFTSLMDVSKIEFNSYFTNPNNEKVEGKVTLDVDKLEPSVSTYAYTFTPNDSNYMSYHGEVDITVYARVSVLDEAGNQLDYDEVEYNSLFKYVPTKKDGYDMPIVKDKDGNIYNAETKITSDVVLTQTEKLTDYTITYHLDDGQNDNDNPSTYTMVDETIVLKNPTKEGYSFDGWFTTEGFDAESRVEEIYPDRLMNYDLYAKFTFIKLIPVEITPLNRTYDGQPHELISVVQNGGEVYYSLNSTNYSNEIPTATDAGTYTVWYKVVGDDTYLDVAPTQIEVTISKSTYDMSTVAFADATITYDGQPHSINYTGTLPSGVTVDIQGQGTNVGEYQITAVFIGDSNNYEAIPNMDATLTITKKNPEVVAPLAKDLVYTGEAQELVTEGTVENGTVQYSLDHENYSNNIPTATNTGTYTVYFKYLVDTSNYNEVEEGSVQVVIASAEVFIQAPVAVQNLVYTGLSQELLTAGVVVPGSVEYKLGNDDWQSSIPTGINAGTYSVSYRFIVDTENYDTTGLTLSGTIAVTITRATVTTTAPTPVEGLVYTGEAHQLINEGTTSVGTVEYRFNNEAWTTDIPTAVNAGTYTISYRYEYDIDNYGGTDTGSVEVVIAKADATYVAPQSKELTYNATAQELVTAGSVTLGTVEYKLDNTTWKTEIPTATNAGTHTVYYRYVVDTNNFNTVPGGNVEVTIAKATYDMTSVSMENKEVAYDGNIYGIQYTGTLPDGVTVSYQGETAEAGTHTITAVFTGDADNYEAIPEMTATLTITKATPVYTTTPSAKNGLVYTGSSQYLINEGVSTGGTILYKINEGEYSNNTPTAVNAGTYTIYYKVDGGNNYEDIEEDSFTVTIGKATPNKILPQAIADLVYNGDAVALSTGGSVSAGTFEFSLDNIDYSNEIPTAVNAGTYTVYYKHSVDATNYDVIPSGSFVVTIAKATYDMSSVSFDDATVTYDGQPHGIEITGQMPTGVTVSYSDSKIEAGTYTITATFTGDAVNYEVIPAITAKLTIVKATPVTEAPIAISGLVYTAEAQVLVTEGTTNTGNVEYSLDYEHYSVNVPVATNAGTHTVYYRYVVDTNNFNTVPGGNVEVTIAKATYDMSSVSFDDATVTYDGQPHGIEITGQMPTGVAVSYSDSKTEAGTYTITATFTGDALNYEAISAITAELTINKANLTVVNPIAKTGLVYTGSAQDLITAGSIVPGTIKYSIGGLSYDTTIPTATNAGTYKVFYKYEYDTANYNTVADGSFDVVIAKATPVLTIPTGINGLVYTGLAQALINEGSTTAGTLVYSLDNINYSTTIPTAANAATYTVYYKVVGDDNYENIDAQSLTVVIEKATPTVTAPTAQNLTYDGTAQALVNAGSINGGTLVYSLDNINYSTTIPTATNAATYTVYYKVNGDDNYNDVAAQTLSITIEKASLTGVIVHGYTGVYDGNSYDAVVNKSATAVDGSTVTWQFSKDGTSWVSMFTVTDVADSGTYYFKASAANHNDYDGDFTVVISNKAATTIDITNIASLSKTYDGNAIVDPIYTTNSDGTVTITYSSNGVDYDSTKPIDAGNYYVKVEVQETATYAVGLKVFNFTIAKATYDMSSVVFADDTVTYDGASHTITATGIPAGLTANYTGSGIDAGTYTITVTFTGDAVNYEAVDSLTATLTINKATLTVVNPVVKTGLVYTGSAQDLITAGSIVPGTIKYSIGGLSYDITIPTATNAGTYKVFYKYEYDTANYNTVADGSFDVVIEKATPVLTIPTGINGLVYTGLAQALINEGSTTAGTLVYSLEENANYLATVPTATNAATYTVYYKVVGDDNYENIDAQSLTVLIEKATPTVTAPTAQNLTYDGTSQALINAGSTNGGTLEYKLNDGAYSTTIPTATNAGTYHIYYRVVGNTNYKDVAEDTFDVTIQKATIETTTPVANSCTYNGNLQELITSGSSSVGSIEYSLDGVNYATDIPTIVGAGTYTVYYRFAGYDQENYNDPASGQITVTVEKATPTVTAPIAKTLTYTGSAQALVNAGSTTGGTLVYSLDNNNFSTTIYTATNAGTYTVYYKVSGDSNYNDVEEDSINVTIQKATYDMSTVSFVDATVTYDGQPHSINYTGTLPSGVTVEITGTGTNVGYYSITATYTGDSNNYNLIPAKTVTLTIEKAPVTIVAPTAVNGLVYNGSAHALVNAGSSNTLGEVEYKLNDGAYSTTVPTATNAGTYTIAYRFNIDSSNYDVSTATLSGTIQVIIAKATYDMSVVSFVDDTVTYDGASHSINYTGTLPAGVTANISGSGKNAGTYTITASFTGDSTNYELIPNMVATLTINKATVTLIAPVAKTNLVYTGSDLALVTEGSSNPTGTVEYKLNDGDYSSTIPTGKNAGSYTVSYRFNIDSENYDVTSLTLSGDIVISIAKATPTVSAPTAKAGLKYTGTSIVLINAGTTSVGNVKYNLNNAGWTTNLPIAEDAGTYEINYKYEYDTTNYVEISGGSIEVTIAKGSVTFTAPQAITNLVYDGNAQALVTEGSSNTSATVEYKLNDGTYQPTVPTGKNAGSYTVSYRLTIDTTNYDVTGLTLSDDIIVTIAYATPTYTNPTTKTLTYTGSAQALVNAGTITPGTIEYSINNTNWSTAIPIGTNAGSYTVYYRFNVTDSNYSQVAGGNVAVTIQKATATKTNPTAKTLTYTGSAQALVNAGTITPGTIEYSIDNTNWSTTIPTGTNAGSYTVYYRFNVNSNYNPVSGGSVAVTIKQATPTYIVPTELSATPGMTLADISLPSGFTFDSPLSTSVGSVGDNTFTITYTPTDTVNYKTVTNISVSIHVSNKLQLNIEAANNQEVTYNAAQQGPTVTVKAGGSVITSGYTLSYQYKLSSASSYTSGLPTNAGTYSIKINCTGDAYDAAQTAEVTFVINKVELTLTTNQVNINYDASNRTWALMQPIIANQISFTGLLGSDTANITVNGMHNGKYKYGTVTGSYIAQGSDTIFSGSSNVIGSTYLAYLGVDNTNYELSKNDVLIKYKTTMIGSTYYTIEDAIAASGTITFAGDSSGDATYVATAFTSLDTSITGYGTTFTVNNRTFMVPYQNSTTVNSTPDFVEGTTRGYVYTALVIPSHITLNFTNNSTLCIDALTIYNQNVSSTYSSTRGVIVNDGEIHLNASTLYAWGYLKGNGHLYLENNSEATDLLDLFDFSGGTIASDIQSNCLPFTAWTLNNISCETYYYSGSTLSGFSHANLSYVGRKTGVAMIIGKSNSSNCLFLPNSTSTSNYIVKKANPSLAATTADNTELRKINGNNQKKGIRQEILIHGNYKDSTISISISVTIKTSLSKSLPISYMDIVLDNDSTLSLTKADYLILPGCKFVVSEGATLTTGSGVDIAFLPWSYFTSTYNFYKNCVDKFDPKFVINGTVNAAGNVGGLVVSEVENAKFALTGSPSASYTMYYTTAGSTNYETKTTKAKLNLYAAGEVAENATVITSSGTYYSIKDSSNRYGFYSTTGAITYNVNGGTGSYSSKNITIGVNGYTLSNSDIPSSNPTRSYYTFGGWYADSDCTIPAIGYTTYCGLDLYAKWIQIEYNINYVDVYDKNFASGNTSTNSNPTTFTYETNETILDAVNGDKVFAGWYSDSSCQNKVLMLDGSNLVNYLSGNSITLYALWYKNGTDKYVITYVNSNTDIICQATETLVDDGLDWSQVQLPVMNQNDNDYTVEIYFDGWYNGDTKVTSLNAGMFTYNSTTGNYELSLTAHWENKNVLSVVVFNETKQVVYYCSGYSFTIPQVSNDQRVTLTALNLVFINWLVDGVPYNSGDRLTLTNQTTVEANLLTFVSLTIGNNEYNTVTVQFISGQGYTVIKDDNNMATATAFSGQTVTNGSTTLVTVGSKFNAKYKYTGNQNNGSATISGAQPTTGLTEDYTQYTVTTSNITITPIGTYKSENCLLATSNVMLADGTTKMAKDLTGDELLISYDHFTGQFVAQKISFRVIVDYDWFEVITLTFENGRTMQVATGHGLYNMTLNKYEIYYSYEFNDHIGEVFAMVDYVDGEFVITGSKLVSVDVEKQYVQKYSPVTEYNVNVVADGVLNIPDDIEGMFDAFEFNEDMTINVEAFMADVAEYGVFEYEDVKDVVPEYLFDVVNFKYFKTFIKKGYLTIDQVNHWIDAYLPYIIEQHNLDFDYENRVLLTEEHLN